MDDAGRPQALGATVKSFRISCIRPSDFHAAGWQGGHPSQDRMLNLHEA